MAKPRRRTAKKPTTSATPNARARAREAEVEAQRSKFIDVIAKGGSVTLACRQAGVHRATPYKWRSAAEDFAKAWDDAKEAGLDNLEDHALKLALAGNERMLMFLLEAGRPEKYRKNVKHNHDHTGSLDVNVDEVRSAIQSKLARVAAAASASGVARQPKR